MFCNWLMKLGNLVSRSRAVVNQATEHLACTKQSKIFLSSSKAPPFDLGSYRAFGTFEAIWHGLPLSEVDGNKLIVLISTQV